MTYIPIIGEPVLAREKSEYFVTCHIILQRLNSSTERPIGFFIALPGT